ncbi:MAG: lysophospholipid acyltransferase family protein [Thermodesulfobacteriota bacterium]
MKKSVLDRLILAVAPWLASWLIRLIHLTTRNTFVGFEEYRAILDRGGRIILAFWHGRLLMMKYAHPRRITALISRSKDGELIARTVERIGVDSARGSSSRGGFGGVKALLKAAKAGKDLAIAPDGPKGPAMKAQMGVIQIAAKTGLPIIPAAFGAEKKKVFGSWDSFILPYPFTRGVYICGKPLRVARNAGTEEMEAARLELERTLTGLTDRADNFFTNA